MNVLDPSRSVESNFRTYQILTNDGAVITGMLAGESANSLRLIDSQGKEQQILREDIEEIDLSIKSLMPEGFESSITKQEMADLLAFLNNRGRYTPLNLISGATLSSAKGLPGFRGAPGDKFEFSSFGTFEFDGVPFELQDPQDGRVANMIALQANSGRFPTTLPASSEVICSGPVSHIHLLTALATFGPPGQNSNSSMIVRVKFEDDSVEDHELFNGKQLASYRDKSDATASKIAMDASGKQIRYTKIDVAGDKPLKSIEFIKGRDFSIPMVFAITVESQADHR